LISVSGPTGKKTAFTKKMSGKNIKMCSIRGCPGNLKLEGRHVFRFPKEHDRWLQWVRASGRLDLEEKGPEYSFRNCKLCSLHFEEKWFKISKRRILLHPDAIPTRFGKDLELSSKIIEIDTEAEKKEEIEVETIQEQTSSAVEKEKGNKIDDIEEEIEMDIEILKPSTSNTSSKTTSKATMSSKKKGSPTKERLCKTIQKLKSRNKVLLQKLRRLQERKKKRTTTKELPHKEREVHKRKNLKL